MRPKGRVRINPAIVRNLLVYASSNREIAGKRSAGVVNVISIINKRLIVRLLLPFPNDYPNSFLPAFSCHKEASLFASLIIFKASVLGFP